MLRRQIRPCLGHRQAWPEPTAASPRGTESSMTAWSTGELGYLQRHAGDGAKAIAESLDRSVRSVESQALRCGISLQRCHVCPKCGKTTYRPLNRVTGWCSTCTKQLSIRTQREKMIAMEEELERELEANRARQCIYSRKNALKNRLEKIQDGA